MEKGETSRLVLRRRLPGRSCLRCCRRSRSAGAWRRQWRQGFATEAAREALRFGFESCGVGSVISIRDVDNDASRRVMEKLGLHFDFQTKVPSHGQPVAVHSAIP